MKTQIHAYKTPQDAAVYLMRNARMGIYAQTISVIMRYAAHQQTTRHIVMMETYAV